MAGTDTDGDLMTRIRCGHLVDTTSRDLKPRAGLEPATARLQITGHHRHGGDVSAPTRVVITEFAAQRWPGMVLGCLIGARLGHYLDLHRASARRGSLDTSTSALPVLPRSGRAGARNLPTNLEDAR